MPLGASRLNFFTKPQEAGGIEATGGSISEADIGGTTYRLHTFTTNGTFEITSGSGTVDVFLVGGGGGGRTGTGVGGGTAGYYGGGAGGGVVEQTGVSASTGTYGITVGAAGAYGATETPGGSSSAFGYTAGGGGASGQFSGATSGSPQSNSGASGDNYANSAYDTGGSGGGAGGNGSPPSPSAYSKGANGGAGLQSSFTGTATYYAAGGGGRGGIGSDGANGTGWSSGGYGMGGQGSNASGMGPGVVIVKYEYNGPRTALTITPNSNAQISTAQSKFGGSSAFFDGTDDYIITEENNNLEIAGDYTIEGWVRGNNVSNGQYIINNRSNSTAGLGQFNIRFFNNLMYFSTNATFANTSVSSNTWYHFAMVRSGSTVTAYLNGVSKGTTTNTTTLGSTENNRIMIGAYDDQSINNELTGYVDEVRISKVARYTGNFTPPTAAFTNDADTVLLLHMDGTNGSTTFTDDNS